VKFEVLRAVFTNIKFFSGISNRHGIIELQTWLLRLRLISKEKYVFNVLVRVCVCSPNNMKFNKRTVNKFISTTDTGDSLFS